MNTTRTSLKTGLVALVLIAGWVSAAYAAEESPLVALALIAGSILAAYAAKQVPAGPTEEQRAEAQTWGQIEGLRAELALMDRDLAAMACTEVQATQVLSALKSWHASNAAALAERDAALAAACRALHQAQQKIHVGPRDEALIARLPALESDASAARAARRQVLDSAASAACGRTSR